MPSILTLSRIMIGGNRGAGGLSASVLAKALYYGKISDIIGGEMPNLVTGATDFITVGGSAGSYTFQVPNTAPYIAADTDYIWFKTDASQRTTTEAELVTYDLQRTPVKYDDNAPHTIREVLILKAGETLTASERDNLFSVMWLPVMWDNTWNDFGHQKENRNPTVQILWVPELVYPSILDDGNTIGFWDSKDLTTITKDGSENISEWRSLIGSEILTPISGGVTFSADGIIVGYTMKTGNLTWSEPFRIYACLKILGHTSNAVIFSGGTGTSLLLQQISPSPDMYVVKDGATYIGPKSSNINTKIVLVAQWLSGANNSKLRLNNGTASLGNATVTLNKLVIAGKENGANIRSFHAYAIIARKISDTAGNETIIHDFLKNRYNV